MGDVAVTDTDTLATALLRGERGAVAVALNLIDDHRAPAREAASSLLTALAEQNAGSNSHLIGMTGPPGAGKSTLGAALLRHWRAAGLTVGVLAVDPSSPVSGGALLGDRLRMQIDDKDAGVFVRSLSNRGEYGGLSSEVWPMSQVMLAAFNVVLVETVGVGQREVDVSGVCDTTCYVAQPGSGDSIQFIKAGILEVPHILVVNKQDMGEVAERTRAELVSTLSRDHPDGNWHVPVLATSATRNTGIAELADTLRAHRQSLAEAGQLGTVRREHQANWVVKQLEQEFGRFGLNKLGGAQQVHAALIDGPRNPFEQYALLREDISSR